MTTSIPLRGVLGSRLRNPIVTSSVQLRRLSSCQATASGDNGAPHKKAVIEEVFTLSDRQQAGTGGSGRTVQKPWDIGWQMNERNVVWNDDLKMRLILRVASEKGQLSTEELQQRLRELQDIIPGLKNRLPTMRVEDIVALVEDTKRVAARMLELKAVFPGADVGAMVLQRIALVVADDSRKTAAAAEQLRKLLPEVDIDRLVQAHPLVLDVPSFTRAVEDARRMMPDTDVQQLLNRNPSVVLSLQRGKDMISYDHVPGSRW